MHLVPRIGSRAMDEAAAQLAENGHDVLPLKPSPSRTLPPHLLEAVERAARDVRVPPSRGLAEFRQAVAATLSSELSMTIDPEQHVLASAGGMHGLYVVFSTLLGPGDEVLAPSPCYYLEGLTRPFGAGVVYVPTSAENEYRWDCRLIESKISSHTKLLFLNTPVNPTGYVLTAGDLEQIAAMARRRSLLIVADECYDRFVYDGRKHLSIAALPAMRERTILIRSFTKSFAMPAWRIGYVVAAAALTEQFTRTLEWMTLYGSGVSQAAATAALRGPQDWLANIAAEFEAKRDLLCKGIQGLRGLSCVKPLGGPFLFLNVSQLRGTCEDIAAVLLREFGIPTVPGSCFQSTDHVRLAFGAPEAVLQELVKRLRLALERLGTK
jgi:aminotransferase